jgi:hypothetical protein
MTQSGRLRGYVPPQLTTIDTVALVKTIRVGGVNGGACAIAASDRQAIYTTDATWTVSS